MKNTTWSSRFTKQLDDEVLDFSQSLNIDIVLYNVDIKVTMAHIDMLASCGHIKDAEKKKINSCLLYTSPSPRDGLLSRMPSSA